MNNQKRLNKMIKISLLSAIAFILMYVEIPVIPAFPWLRMDLSDVPALMGAFAFGPLIGVIIELFKNILIILFKGTATGLVGELANFLVGISLVLPASIIYHRNKSKKTAIIGMILGFLSIEVVAILVNMYILLPAFGMHMAGKELINYIVFGLIPFNGVKSIIVSFTTFLLYKRLSVTLFKVEPMLGGPKKV
ncbi:ECF transporter S component [Clostridium senegalense]|uniref:ECF transporter S component n=1 Tax=Clostridium senegalense TaxID=1465809 RepID=UPI001C10B226|nr:ECF transporter S component [Clostridium senegalense]MBU5227407.1 ECF transporter S component [Clostridium senegalense]